MNLDALGCYLSENVKGFSGPLKVEPISGGQSNPTFFVTSPTHRLVLRKQPEGPLLPKAHALDREYKIQDALAKTGVPVPQMIALCQDKNVLGTDFYVMHRLHGKVIHDNALGEADIGKRRAMYKAAAKTMAALHSVGWQEIGLGDYGRPDNYFERQINRWIRQWEGSKTRDIPDLEKVIPWLQQNIPAPTGPSIVHGDFRIGNIMFSDDGSVAALLDWELSTIGDPMADLAHFSMGWDSSPDEYDGVKGLDLNAEGLPTREEFQEWYNQAGGDISTFSDFHRIFALFRFSIIFEGIATRAAAGNAAGENANEVSSLALNFARRAAELLEG